MASSRMPRLMAWVARVCRSRCGCTPGSAGGPADAVNDAADQMPVQGSAAVGDKPLAASYVLEVGGGPAGEQLHQLGVQRHVPVVAELAERDAQPVARADPHDRVGLQVRQLAGPHPGPGQQLDDEPVAGVGAGPGGGHQPGRVAVVEELRQRLGLLGDVPGDDRVTGRRIGPVPFDDPLEELAHGPHPLPVCLRRDRPASRPGPGGQPHLVVLDVIAADIADRGQPGLGDHPAGELAQRVVCRIDAPGRQERAQLPQVAAHHGGDPGRGDLDLGPLGVSVQPAGCRSGAGTALTGRPPLARPASRRRRRHQRR